MTPAEQLRLILSKMDAGEPLVTSRRALLEVNGNYGFIFGLGGFSRFIEKYQTEPDPTMFYAFSLVAKTVFSALCKGPLASTIFAKFPVQMWRDQSHG